MHRRRMLAVVACLLAIAAWLPAQDRAEHTAVQPEPRKNREGKPDEGWIKRHEAFVAIAKRGNVDLLLLGDSITDAWGGEGRGNQGSGAKIYKEHFEPLKVANFGIGGDRTQHVLWRLQNGSLQGIKPKAVMLMIGTNNSNGKDNTGEEIADGIKAIVGEIHKQSPDTKVLLLAVFPRKTGNNPELQKTQTEKIDKINEIIAKLDDGKKVKFLNISKAFLESDGSIPKDVMPDQLHLSEKGYQLWYDAVKDEIKRLLAS